MTAPFIPSQPDLFDLAAARSLRDDGMALVDDAEGDAWKQATDDAIELLARSGAEFTADTLRRFVGEPVHCAAWGPRFQAAVRGGVIERVGFQQSERPLARTRVLAVYRGCR